MGAFNQESKTLTSEEALMANGFRFAGKGKSC
jgi:hypothetical protein